MILDAVTTTAPTVASVDWLTPAFLVALGTLVTALTGMILALRAIAPVKQAAASAQEAHQTVKESQATLATVAEQTNGPISDLRRQLDALSAQVAAQAPVPTHRGRESLKG